MSEKPSPGSATGELAETRFDLQAMLEELKAEIEAPAAARDVVDQAQIAELIRKRAPRKDNG